MNAFFFTLLVAVTVFSVAHAMMSKEEKVKCFVEATDKVQTETDADLKEKILSTLKAVKGVSDKVKSLTDGQKQAIVKNYFTGSCDPLKSFFD